jgi:hypothetical protein
MTTRAAFWTLAIGSGVIFLSLFDPFYRLITPFAHGVEVNPDAPYTYIRALFGLIVSLAVAVGVTWWDRKSVGKASGGLELSTLSQAIIDFKGGRPNYKAFGRSKILPINVVESDQIIVRLPAKVMQDLAIEPGDLLHVADSRWWLGGFRSLSAKAGPAAEDGTAAVLSRSALELGNLKLDRPVRVEKIL